MAFKTPEDDTEGAFCFFLFMNGKHVFRDLPFDSNQMAGINPLHYGRCLLSYLLGCRHPRESKVVWLPSEAKKKRKSWETACYFSPISEI